jgi:hypothetical protein
MKTALVTTTINVPHVLRLYRRADPDVRFFIATDDKTPDLTEFSATIYPSTITRGEEWKCSDLIGRNCIQRRNIATLEALRWGADLIVFVDDDTFPLNTEFFQYFHEAFADHNGLLASPEIEWFDVGKFLDPQVPHRGFPHEWTSRQPRLSHVVDAKIGAAAGIVMGDPDCSAISRIARHPEVLRVSPLLGAGIVVNPKFTRTVWNTQCSAITRELTPAMLLCPQFRRYDDILASLVCQRVMADTGHHIRFGTPFTWQNRNAHDLTRDLNEEQWGNEHILDVQALLWRTNTDGIASVANRVLRLYAALDTMMPGVAALAEAWVEDCRSAMG